MISCTHETAEKTKTLKLALMAPWGERKHRFITAESGALRNGSTGAKVHESSQWLAEIGHNPILLTGSQGAPAPTHTKNT